MRCVIEIKGSNGKWLNVATCTSQQTAGNLLKDQKWLRDTEASFLPEELTWPTEFRTRDT